MSAEPKKTEVATTQQSAFEDKWGHALIAAGYGAVPNVIIQRHKQLGMLRLCA